MRGLKLLRCNCLSLLKIDVMAGTEALDRSMERRIFFQRAMNSAFIIVGSELDEDTTQVCLPEHDQVVDALPPDRADQSFRKTVLPWRTG